MRYPKPDLTGWYAGKGGVEFIVEQIKDEDRYKTENFRQLAKSLKGSTDEQTFENVWKFVRSNVRYVADTGAEKVKSAARTLYDAFGDCKSMSILTAVLLRELGYSYFYRITGYDRENPQKGHIYVMGLTKTGKRVPVDPVNSRFNDQPKWVWKKDTQILRAPGAGSSVNQINGMIKL